MKKIFLFALALAVGFTSCVEDDPYTGIVSVSHAPGAVTPSDDVTVTANVINLSSATLKYKAGSATEQSVTMTGAGNIMTGVIPQQIDGTKVTYYVQAEDITSETKEYTVSAVVVDYTFLVLNEINGNATLGDNAGKSIELFNKGTEAIPLEGVVLIKNNVENPWWTGSTASGSIPAGGYVVIIQNNSVNPALSGSSGISPKKSFKIELKNPLGVSLDVFLRGKEDALDQTISDVTNITLDQSFQRCPNGIGAWKLAIVTVGKENRATGIDIPQE